MAKTQCPNCGSHNLSIQEGSLGWLYWLFTIGCLALAPFTGGASCVIWFLLVFVFVALYFLDQGIGRYKFLRGKRSAKCNACHHKFDISDTVINE